MYYIKCNGIYGNEANIAEGIVGLQKFFTLPSAILVQNITC